MKPSALELEVNPLGTHGTGRCLVSDRIVTPPEYLPARPLLPMQVINSAVLQDLDQAVTYTEGVMLLPPRVASSFSARHHHYNLHELPLRTEPQHRRRALQAELGLPANRMIMAYAGRMHAVTDASLAAWLAILARAPLSVLLLPDHPPGARQHLEQRAARMGLDHLEARLVWNSDMALNETARCRVLAAVDLVLDTPARSLGGGVAQALLAAAPMVSLPQRSLGSRAATSQLLAAYPETGGPPLLEDHAPHLIARNMDDFVDLASRAAHLKLSGKDGDDWLPFVPYHDIREQLLHHDGMWSATRQPPSASHPASLVLRVAVAGAASSALPASASPCQPHPFTPPGHKTS
jgi:hypothetical protein